MPDNAKYPAAIILSARQKRDAKEFERRVVARTPVRLDYDDIELECGHRVTLMDHVPWQSNVLSSCEACAIEWMSKQAA
jgi:hypothetical protein